MAHTPQTPSKSLSPALLKAKPSKAQFDEFKSKLSELVEKIKSSPSESEEHHKNHISDFLKYAFKFPAYFINTSERIDLAVHNGKSATDSVGVILEVKRPGNQAEMPMLDNLNVRAMQELVLYYLRERLRIMGKNYAVKYLVITNGYEWFIFDAQVFEKAFANNAALVKQFNEFEAGRLSGNTTDFFYKEIAKPAIEKMGEVEFTHFDLRDKRSDKQTIALLKLFSPEHLLKLPFVNDSNSLNKDFYSELLHIIGLVEVKDGSKKLIQRKKEGERNRASLLENAISKMDALDKLRNFEKPTLYGDTNQEQLFNVGLELAITWVNRVLFLKLLEAQLLAYHKEDKSYAFLNIRRIRSFDDLDGLFFEVLARKPAEREAEIQKTFAKVPYLNSSLFETTEIERKVLNIGNLSGEITLPIFSSTVLKDGKGKRRTGELNTLEYLFAFLEAYDFASEGTDELKDDSKALINASVLGLIFEKINGYKDGSFFTPGFITMYMCRETLRRAVVQKFNEVKGWTCKDIDELEDKIEAGVEARAEANTIINSLKICDPAVGSGHFLVSALNELIAIKAELGVLQDAEGKRLKNYSIQIINDELLVLDEEGDEFNYNPSNPESARIQKTLFNEKQTLIENCLFGVDINPNSVKICRLRLWIELLKNAYYNADGQLETLPNIDINIKVGNSLISRFALDADLKDALKKSKLSLTDYRKAVDTYRNASSKEQKREMEQLIEKIKNDFRSEILYHDKKSKNLIHLGAELKVLELPQTLLEESAKEKKERKLKQEKLKQQFDKLNAEIEAIKHNKIYQNAFEWRFEFPEVLDDDGAFVGFDVVIGNPPYIDSEGMVKNGLENDRIFLSNTYKYTKGNWDIYIAFFERGMSLMRPHGNMIYITPDKWLSKPFGAEFRQANLHHIRSIVKLGRDVFDSAIVDSIVTHLSGGSGETISSAMYDGVEYNELNSLSSATISADSFDSLMSAQLPIILKVESCNETVKDILVCESACATSDAYKIQPLIKNLLETSLKDGEYFKVANTGTLSKYTTRWGLKEMVYLKSKYIQPVVDKLEFQKHFNNSYYRKSIKPKIILKGLTLLDAALDLDGQIIPGKSTLVLASSDVASLKYICAILNSRLILSYIKERHSSSSYNGGIVFTKEMINDIPLPTGENIKSEVVAVVDQILALKKQNPSADTTALENKIDQLVYALYDLTPEEIAIVEGKSEQGADHA